jgi:hypothetical protein
MIECQTNYQHLIKLVILKAKIHQCKVAVALVGTLKSRIPFYFKRTQMHRGEYQHIANCIKYN